MVGGNVTRGVRGQGGGARHRADQEPQVRTRAPRPSSFTLPPFRLLPASPALSRVLGSACARVDSPATA